MKQKKRGLFVTIEGGEGVGKSTNINFVAQVLDSNQIPYVLTREPGGTPLAEDIRELLLEVRKEKVTENTELLLMFAARSQHIVEIIEPALKAGKWVICDRFTDATFAYQGGGRGISVEKIAAFEQWVQGSLRPDYTILLDAPIAVGLERANKRGKLDRIEREQKQFFESVRKMYLALAKQHRERFRVVDASQALESVQGDLSVVLDEMIASFVKKGEQL